MHLYDIDRCLKKEKIVLKIVARVAAANFFKIFCFDNVHVFPQEQKQ